MKTYALLAAFAASSCFAGTLDGARAVFLHSDGRQSSIEVTEDLGEVLRIQEIYPSGYVHTELLDRDSVVYGLSSVGRRARPSDAEEVEREGYPSQPTDRDENRCSAFDSYSESHGHEIITRGVPSSMKVPAGEFATCQVTTEYVGDETHIRHYGDVPFGVISVEIVTVTGARSSKQLIEFRWSKSASSAESSH